MTDAKELSNAALRVQDALVSKGLPCRVVELAASTRTAQDAATAIGCQVAQIMKSIVLRTATTRQPILVLASGVNRVNEKIIEALCGEKIEKADAEFVREVTGFAIGGIPPIGHVQAIKTFIDEDLFAYEELWAAAGTPHAVFSLYSRDIKQLTNGIVASIK